MSDDTDTRSSPTLLPDLAGVIDDYDDDTRPLLGATETAVSEAYAPRIIDRHFGVVDEEAALAGAQIAHDIKISRALKAASDRQQQVSAPELSPPAQPLAEALPEAQDWRAKLGLG